MNRTTKIILILSIFVIVSGLFILGLQLTHPLKVSIETIPAQIIRGIN